MQRAGWMLFIDPECCQTQTHWTEDGKIELSKLLYRMWQNVREHAIKQILDPILIPDLVHLIFDFINLGSLMQWSDISDTKCLFDPLIEEQQYYLDLVTEVLAQVERNWGRVVSQINIAIRALEPLLQLDLEFAEKGILVWLSHPRFYCVKMEHAIDIMTKLLKVQPILIDARHKQVVIDDKFIRFDCCL